MLGLIGADKLRGQRTHSILPSIFPSVPLSIFYPSFYPSSSPFFSFFFLLFFPTVFFLFVFFFFFAFFNLFLSFLFLFFSFFSFNSFHAFFASILISVFFFAIINLCFFFIFLESFSPFRYLIISALMNRSYTGLFLVGLFSTQSIILFDGGLGIGSINPHKTKLFIKDTFEVFNEV